MSLTTNHKPFCTLHQSTGIRDLIWCSSISVILLAACVAKLYAIRTDSSLLRTIDPILGVPLRQTAALAVIIEITAVIVIGYCMFTARTLYARLAGLLIGLVFLSYRITIYCLGYTVCPCLGGALASLGLDAEFESQLMLASVIYILISSLRGLEFSITRSLEETRASDALRLDEAKRS